MCGKLKKVVLFLQLSVLLVLSRPQSFVGAIYTSKLFRLTYLLVMSGGRGVIIKIYIIVFDDTVIDQKSEIMLLGVILDDQLSFSSKQCL